MIERVTSSAGNGPIVISGIGGSATRAVAGVFEALGICLGNNQNSAKDNLGVRPIREIKQRELEGSRVFESTPTPIAAKQAMSILRHRIIGEMSQDHVGWGWKNAGSWLYLDWLAQYFPGMRFVWVMRHGLDMAFSSNHNQVRNWGWLFEINYPAENQHVAALEYWLTLNPLIINYGTKILGRNFYVLNVNKMYHHESKAIRNLGKFLCVDIDVVRKAISTVMRELPEHRYRGKLKKVRGDYIDRVASLGFEIH